MGRCFFQACLKGGLANGCDYGLPGKLLHVIEKSLLAIDSNKVSVGIAAEIEQAMDDTIVGFMAFNQGNLFVDVVGKIEGSVYNAAIIDFGQDAVAIPVIGIPNST